MKRLPHFELHQPASVAEASSALSHYDGEAAVYAGGTELLLAMKEMVLRYEHLVDIKTIPGMRGIAEAGDAIVIGAATTHRDVEVSPIVRKRIPMLAETARRIANPRVRSAGTFGGNLCFAEPHSDLATLLLCLDGRCVVANEERERTVPVKDLLVDSYETSLEPNEILVSVVVPIPAPGSIGGYTKFQVHERPMLGVAAVLQYSADGADIADARLAVGAVSPTPRRSDAAEMVLCGPARDVLARIPEAAQRLADDADLIDDEVGTGEYKRHLIGVLLGRLVSASLESGSVSKTALERPA